MKSDERLKNVRNREQLCSQRWQYILEHHKIRCLELSISEACNYHCTYCIFHRNNSQTALMPVNIAVKKAKDFDDYLNNESGIIYFGSGEPMLNWDAIVNVCESLEQRKSKIELRFMTNASLMTMDKFLYIQRHNIKVGLSIDGNKARQNKSRIPNVSSIDSFGVIMRALEYARAINYPVFSLSATYAEKGFTPDASFVMHLCKEYNVQEFDLDFDIASLALEDIEIIADELIQCYHKARELGLNIFGYWLIPFLNKCESVLSANYCGNSTGTSICIAADGTVKVCGYDPKNFGEIADFVNLFKNSEYLNYLKKYNLEREACLDCKIFEFCCGQCIFHDKGEVSWMKNCLLMKSVVGRLESLENKS